ncbi:MAG: GDSL-type esterase/lipase family protein, partial [Alphaproteobacteria bacterium]
MTNDIRICFFGESYLQGFGDTTGQGLPGRLTAHEAAHGRMVTAYNMAIRGETVRDLARRWPAELAPRLATMPRSDAALGLVFLFGTNDVSDNGLAQG